MGTVKGLVSFNRRHSLPAILLFVLITVAPLAMAVRSLYPSVIRTISVRPDLMALGYRILSACACTLVAVVLALPGAYIFARLRFPFKGILKALCLLCFTVPLSAELSSIEIIESLIGFRPPFAFFNSAVALVFTNVPPAVLIIYSYWRTFDGEITDSAATLGSGKFHVFRTVTLPYLRCAIRGTASIVFIRCLSFCLEADALVSFVISLAAAAVFCNAFFGRKKDTAVRIRYDETRPRKLLSHVFVLVSCLVLLCMTLAGPGILFYRVLFPEGHFSTAPCTDLFSSLFSNGFSDLTGLVLILASSLIATVIASRLVFAARFMGFPVLIILICLAADRNLLLAGYQALMAFLPGYPDCVPVILAGTAYLVPIAAVVMLPSFRTVDSGLMDVASTLGSTAGRAYRTTAGKQLFPCGCAAFLLCTAIMTGSLENQGPALTSVMTAISFILLLVGSSLLRKVHHV